MHSPLGKFFTANLIIKPLKTTDCVIIVWLVALNSNTDESSIALKVIF